MSKKKVSNKKFTVSINLSQATCDILDDLVVELGLSRSKIVRDLIEDEIVNLKKHFKKGKGAIGYHKIRNKIDAN